MTEVSSKAGRNPAPLAAARAWLRRAGVLAQLLSLAILVAVFAIGTKGKYLSWANQYKENQITIVYDTMWNGTRVMAEHIAKGLHSADAALNVKLFNAAQRDKNDIIAEIFKSKALVLGSPTINKGILTSIAALLEEIRGLGFKGKKAAVFGAYGWSGESVGVLKDSLARAGFHVVDDGLKALWNPDDEARGRCFEYGRKLAAELG